MGKTGEWLGHFKAIMPVREKYSKTVGLWRTEFAQLNEVVHLCAYRDLNDRAAVRANRVARRDALNRSDAGAASPMQ